MVYCVLFLQLSCPKFKDKLRAEFLRKLAVRKAYLEHLINPVVVIGALLSPDMNGRALPAHFEASEHENMAVTGRRCFH